MHKGRKWKWIYTVVKIISVLNKEKHINSCTHNTDIGTEIKPPTHTHIHRFTWKHRLYPPWVAHVWSNSVHLKKCGLRVNIFTVQKMCLLFCGDINSHSCPLFIWYIFFHKQYSFVWINYIHWNIFTITGKSNVRPMNAKNINLSFKLS